MVPRRALSSFAVSLAVATLSPASRVVAAGGPALSLHAFAWNLSGGGRARAGTVDITIERWSSDQEREQLHDALIEKGSGALLAALQKLEPRAGFIRSSTGLGWDIHYAREHVFDDGSRRLVLATDRPMSFWELSNDARSADYEFTLAEIHLDRNGKGEGRLATAAKISWNRETRSIEIENYGNEPVRLSEVVAIGAKGQ